MTPLALLAVLALAAIPLVLLIEALRKLQHSDDWDAFTDSVEALNGCGDPDCPECWATL